MAHEIRQILAEPPAHETALANELPHDLAPPPSPADSPTESADPPGAAEVPSQEQRLLAARTALVVANGYLDLAEQQLARQQEVLQQTTDALAQAEGQTEAERDRASVAEQMQAESQAVAARLQGQLESATTDLHSALEELTCAQAELDVAKKTTEKVLARVRP
jgi:hypothetical protein